VITNVFSGRLGYIIARQAASRGADVLLVVGLGRIFLGAMRNLKPSDLKIL